MANLGNNFTDGMAYLESVRMVFLLRRGLAARYAAMGRPPFRSSSRGGKSQPAL